VRYRYCSVIPRSRTWSDTLVSTWRMRCSWLSEPKSVQAVIRLDADDRFDAQNMLLACRSGVESGPSGSDVLATAPRRKAVIELGDLCGFVRNDHHLYRL
jgi:hypothetical protein